MLHVSLLCCCFLTYRFVKHRARRDFQSFVCPAAGDQFHCHSGPVFSGDAIWRNSAREEKWRNLGLVCGTTQYKVSFLSGQNKRQSVQACIPVHLYLFVVINFKEFVICKRRDPVHKVRFSILLSLCCFLFVRHVASNSFMRITIFLATSIWCSIYNKLFWCASNFPKWRVATDHRHKRSTDLPKIWSI